MAFGHYLGRQREERDMTLTELGPVEIHREFITAAARWMMAAKL